VVVRALFETFMSVPRSGRTTGKLKMAISEKLLLALEAMAATMVNTDARPKLPRTRMIIKRGTFTTGFPISKRKKIKENTERMVIKSRLYRIFERRIPWGLAIV
jgi:hypothetical protein